MQFQSIANLLSCILDLKRDIVAVTLAPTTEVYNEIPATELKRSLAFCMMVRLATMGHGRKASKTQFGCPGSSEVFLFRKPKVGEESGKRLFSFGLYEDQSIASEVQGSMAVIPAPCFGVAVQPLSSCTSSPASLILFVTAYQAMRLTQAWNYSFGPLQEMSFFGNRGVCAECVAAPLSSGNMHISPLCSNTRYVAKWEDSELGVGIPYHRLDDIIKGLIQTIPVVEPPQRLEAIKKRCKQAAVDLHIDSAKTYFYSV